ncbi:MAG: MipA/OmpV family protein [Kordiimonadaceae bacterium]|nr:MipA/OmpV family protein [Kordiimonadaceae bacterium]
MTNLTIRACLGGLLFLFSYGISASDVDFRFSGKPIYIQSEDIEDDRKKDNWSGRLGIGIEVSPDFLGADGHSSALAFDFKGSYKERIFIENNKFGALLHKGKLLRAGIISRAIFGREQNLVQADLGGLAEVDTAFELGLFAGTSFYKLFLTGEVYVDVSGVHKGFSAELEGGYTFEVNSSLTVTPILGAIWGSGRYMDRYFGVEEGASDIFPAFNPDGGLYEVYLEGAMEQRLSKKWVLKASLRLSDLQGSAEKSPIVRGAGGSNSQVTAFVAVAWLF